ncbi:MAG: 4-hydroxy-tetrahydrodipicolinate reductase [Candidatus Kapabacteria bacterium]|nr:4-hydroxy-tetrahydrodipicolinate reductase [Candidatus Kapabacteria bacterium]
MTRIAIVGYGAMGHEIERLAPSVGCEVTRIYDEYRPLTVDGPNEFDVAIDFSLPEAVRENVRILCAMNRSVVIGTTGWHDQLSDIKGMVEATQIGCVWGSNFSVGVQMFLRIVRAAAIMAQDTPEYDVMVHEWHHHRKKDSPSGTAISVANVIIDEMNRKNHIAIETQHGRIDPSALHVTSSRGGEIVGRHTVTLDSAFDTIDIVHNAKNRSGFAHGALLAAPWIKDRKGFYEFTDVYPEIGAGSSC